MCQLQPHSSGSFHSASGTTIDARSSRTSGSIANRLDTRPQALRRSTTCAAWKLRVPSWPGELAPTAASYQEGWAFGGASTGGQGGGKVAQSPRLRPKHRLVGNRPSGLEWLGSGGYTGPWATRMPNAAPRSARSSVGNPQGGEDSRSGNLTHLLDNTELSMAETNRSAVATPSNQIDRLTT